MNALSRAAARASDSGAEPRPQQRRRGVNAGTDASVQVANAANAPSHPSPLGPPAEVLAQRRGRVPLPLRPHNAAHSVPALRPPRDVRRELTQKIREQVLSYLDRADFIRMGNVNSFWRAASRASGPLSAQLTEQGHDFSWPVGWQRSVASSLAPRALHNELLRRLRVQKQYTVGAMRRVTLPCGPVALVFCGFVNKGRHVMQVFANGSVCLADVTQRYITAKEVLSEGPEFCRATLAVSTRGDKLVTAMGPGSHTVTLYAPGRARIRPRQVAVHRTAVTAVALSTDNRTLATASADGEIKVCDLKRPRSAPLIAQVSGDQIASLHFGPHKRLFAACVRAGDRAYVLDLSSTAEPMAHLVAETTGGIASMAFANDGAALVTGSGAGYTTLWEFTQPAPTVTRLAWQQGSVCSVAVPADAPLVLTAGDDATAWLLDLRPAPPHYTALVGHTAAVTHVAFTRRTRFVLTASADGTARIWDTAKKPVSFISLAAGDTPVTSVESTPDGRFVLTVCTDNTVRLWDFDL